MGYNGSPLDTRGKITLDRGTFKILASETRVGILKKLDEKQMTVSDLSRALGMNKATLFEHLEKLIEADLIKKKEDERKWVYYNLTWKGKNILHPERTKIAIVLSISLIFSILIIYLLSLAIGGGIFDSRQQTNDYVAPTIDIVLIEDITEKTTEPVEVSFEISDNKGIKENSLKIEYTISNSYTQEPATLNGWQELPLSINQNTVTIVFPSINWSNNSDKYLYIRSSVADNSSNSMENVYVEYIEKIYENSIDLSINVPDVIFESDISSIPSEGDQVIPIQIKIHNTGSFNITDVELSIFSNNPDTDGDGLVDNITSQLNNHSIGFIESGNVTIVESSIELNLSRTNHFWVAIDPLNTLNESDEQNNIINVNIHTFSSKSIIPEFPPHLGAFIVILIVLIYNFYRKKEKIGNEF